MTSWAPGQVATPRALLSAEVLAASDDVQLAHTAAAILAEQHRRAVSDNDMDALLEEAFVEAFPDGGGVAVPWTVGGVLVCPGLLRHKSATSHDCTFVSIDGTWVWEHPEVIVDVMRQVPGPKVVKHSISLLTVTEGMVLDVVSSTSRSGGACQMRKVTSYQVRGGQLVAVTTRARAPQGHSRT